MKSVICSLLIVASLFNFGCESFGEREIGVVEKFIINHTPSSANIRINKSGELIKYLDDKKNVSGFEIFCDYTFIDSSGIEINLKHYFEFDDSDNILNIREPLGNNVKNDVTNLWFEKYGRKFSKTDSSVLSHLFSIT